MSQIHSVKSLILEIFLLCQPTHLCREYFSIPYKGVQFILLSC